MVTMTSSVATNVPFWTGMLITGEAIPAWGWGAYGKSLYLSLNSAVNLNLL